MAEKGKAMAPPYASFSAFMNFLNKLRDTSIPSRIDPTVFGNASGSVSYSIIAALKSLKLIDGEGAPSGRFVELVNASDDDRKSIMETVVRGGYPTLFGDGINVEKATAGQLDEHIRQTYDASGSTVDKVAAFFIAAAVYAGIGLSHHIKARKATAVSASAGKSKKQRRADTDHVDEVPAFVPITPPMAKELEYQLIDLMKEDGIGDEERNAIWALVRYLTAKKKAADQ